MDEVDIVVLGQVYFIVMVVVFERNNLLDVIDLEDQDKVPKVDALQPFHAVVKVFVSVIGICENPINLFENNLILFRVFLLEPA